VLVVDDEQLVRDVTCQMLQSFGFSVLSADGGNSAIAEFERHSTAIDVVVLDMTMPDMSGDQVLIELRKRRDGVRVLLCSGYSESDVVARIGSDGRCAFLQKPYTITALIDKIQQVLGTTSLD
jgi:CheY-like chemotaxis protein